MDSSEVDDIKHAAQKLLSEGNYLQSLEEFSTILVNHPNDQEALEGRLSACLELKLFHRCLKDIETLIQINPCDTKVHNLAGQIYEQIGAYKKSICAYLKAYLYEQQTDYRLETVQKISQLCSKLLGETHAEIP
ncbi:tetratricopeptide repeat, partial [Paramuricea clavata]